MSEGVTDSPPNVPPPPAVETSRSSSSALRRSTVRAVAMPTEHGGWGLTLEPVLLGLLVSWSWAGLLLGLAAFAAFMARTPLKVLLVDAHRRRSLPRTAVARKVLAVELLLLAALVAGAVALDASPFWTPLIVIAPLVAIELWFDMRSRSRRVLPELVGAVGMAGVAAVIVLAGGGGSRLAGACWLILAGRSVTAIPTVRDLVGRIHHRTGNPRHLIGTDVAAAIIAGLAVVADRTTLAGAAAVLAAIAIQRVLNRGTLPSAVVLGIRQSMVGLAVVAATALGVLLT